MSYSLIKLPSNLEQNIILIFTRQYIGITQDLI